MKKPHLIDTNIFIDLLREYPPATLFFSTQQAHYYSAITETELLARQENANKRKRMALLTLLGQLEKIHVDNPLAEHAGDLCRKYRIDVPDAIIAASALQCGAVLVTRNKKHFEKVKDLEIEVPY